MYIYIYIYKERGEYLHTRNCVFVCVCVCVHVCSTFHSVKLVMFNVHKDVYQNTYIHIHIYIYIYGTSSSRFIYKYTYICMSMATTARSLACKHTANVMLLSCWLCVMQLSPHPCVIYSYSCHKATACVLMTRSRRDLVVPIPRRFSDNEPDTQWSHSHAEFMSRHGPSGAQQLHKKEIEEASKRWKQDYKIEAGRNVLYTSHLLAVYTIHFISCHYAIWYWSFVGMTYCSFLNIIYHSFLDIIYYAFLASSKKVQVNHMTLAKKSHNQAYSQFAALFLCL